LKATEPIADPVFEIDGVQGLGQGRHLVDCPAPVVRDGGERRLIPSRLADP